MFPYYAFPTASDSDYLRALAEERAAREQYAAARRAQEDARARAARAQAARRAYASPYSSYLGGDSLTSPYNDFDMAGDSLGNTFDPYGLRPTARSLSPGYEDPYAFGYRSSPYAQRALMEERRRRELMEVEREKERKQLEEERIRQILREEREREEAARQKLVEEQRMRRALEEERLTQALREEEEARERERAQMRAQQQTSVDPIDILRALGLAPPASASVPEQERFGRRTGTSTSPSGVHRTAPSPVRPFPFGRTSAARRAARKTPSPQPTTIPISSPSPAPPTPEQIAAAEHILTAYRAHVSRKASLATISSIRQRFLASRSGFTLPTTLDYDVASNGRAPPTTVVLSPDANIAELVGLEEDVLEGAPSLAYSATNAPLHAYEEELNLILGVLDAVESQGDMGVRAARRELAREVEREAEKVERWRGVVWRWWAESQKAASAPAPAMMVTEPQATAFTSKATEDEPFPTEPIPTEPIPTEPIPTEPLSSTASAPQTGETSTVAEAPQETMPVEAPMEVEATSASDSSAAPAPTLISNPEDVSVPSFTIPISSSTPPEPVEVVEPVPAAEVITETTHDSDAPLPLEAFAVEPVASTSTPDVAPESHESARPATPALSQGPSEPEETEVEPVEVHTPPPVTQASVVAVDVEAFSETLQVEQKEPVLGATDAPQETTA